MEKMTNTHQNQNTNFLIRGFNDQADKFEEARFFWMAVYIILQSCLGSIACGFILKNHGSMLVLCTSAAVTMASNAVFIAQGDKKVCMIIFYLSIILNTIFIITNI